MKRIFVGDFKLGRDEKKTVIEVLNRGRISEGSKVRDFENLWADYVGTKYAAALSSGTSALIRLPNADYAGKNGFYIGCYQYLEKKIFRFYREDF